MEGMHFNPSHYLQETVSSCAKKIAISSLHTSIQAILPKSKGDKSAAGDKVNIKK